MYVTYVVTSNISFTILFISIVYCLFLYVCMYVFFSSMLPLLGEIKMYI